MTKTVVMLGKFVLFSYGRAKGRDKRGHGGEAPKWGLFLQNSHDLERYKLYLTNCWSDKLLITTKVIGMTKNLYAETFKWYGAVLHSQKQLVNICPQWCRCLQQGDWYSTAEGFQPCYKVKQINPPDEWHHQKIAEIAGYWSIIHTQWD